MEPEVGSPLMSEPATVEQWFDWLSRAQEALVEEYLLRGGRRLVSDYRHENSIAREYVGREVLELLQNAGDAAADSEIEGKVSIHLLKEGLVVANTGCPFTAGGVDSLQTANLSPKKGRRKSMIGEKGLGFRAILNWTDSPLIDSGQLRIIFSRRFGGELLDKLLASSADLTTLVEKERNKGDELILPALAFPAFDKERNLDRWFDTSEQSTIASKCACLREEGYDTVIGMPFRNTDDFEVAKKQLEELRPEILLFVDSLCKIVINIESEEQPRVWRRKPVGSRSYEVIEDERVRGAWTIHRSDVQSIPEEHRDEGADGAQHFEIVIANPKASSGQGSPLFTYFPTEVIIPHSVVCHATLQLDGSRKHPTSGKANCYILTKLAQAIADTAEEQACGADPWAGLRLISASGDYPVELKQVGFSETLQAAAAEKDIVPCLDGQFRRAGGTLLLKGAMASWVPARLFPEVVSYPENEDEWDFLSALPVAELSAKEFGQRLSSEALSDEERVALITGIVRNCVAEEFHLSELLLDSSGGSVGPGTRVFLPPSGVVPEVLEWVALCFLSKGLRKRLQEALGISEQRDLQRALSAFGVVEFSRASVIRSAVAEASRRCRDDPENESVFRKGLLQFLLASFRSAKEGDEGGGRFPSESGLKLLNQKGAYVPARDLYLADGYGVSGSITQGLYQSWAPEKLAASKDEMGLEGEEDEEDEEDELASFLQWVGVAKAPREISESRRSSDFDSFVISSLNYPARFEDYTFSSAGEVSNLWIREYKTVDGLSEILKSAAPVAVLGWLALDSRFDGWGQNQILHCQVTAMKDGDRKYREYYRPVPSFISWKISTIAWLPSSTGELRAPVDCLIASKHIEVLFPRPADFATEEKEGMGLVSTALYRGWERAGVLPGLERLGIDQIYGLLLAMPDKSPDGRAARALSRWLLENTGIVNGVRGKNYAEFAEGGLMWGELGDHEGYFPVNEMWHRDSEALPKKILDELVIVDLPTRVGAKRVEFLFHVKSLADASISQEVAAYRKAPMSDAENNQFQDAKPFLKRMRVSQSSNAESLDALDRLDLVLCDQLVVQLLVEGKKSEIEVGDWESVLERDCLFVKADRNEGGSISRDLLTDCIGNALAGLFGLTTGDAFAKICRCCPKDRPALLRRMCGEESLLGLVSIEEAEEQLRNIPIHKVQSLSRSVDQPGEVEDAEEIEASSEEQSNPFEARPPSHEEIEGIDVVSTLHSPREPNLTRKLVVRRTTSSGGSSRSVRRVTDGDICEQLGFFFEIEQGRFPIAMGNIMGVDGAGCDIFSFDSNEDRARFGANQPRDMGLVRRFIEVKGRGDAEAKIDLRGNEYACARERAERYFLYRLYESGDGSYFLTVLQDPLQQEEAVSHAVVVDLDAAAGSQRFELRPLSRNEQGVDDNSTGLG